MTHIYLDHGNYMGVNMAQGLLHYPVVLSLLLSAWHPPHNKVQELEFCQNWFISIFEVFGTGAIILFSIT